jgi:hypothetical protein
MGANPEKPRKLKETHRPGVKMRTTKKHKIKKKQMD